MSFQETLIQKARELVAQPGVTLDDAFLDEGAKELYQAHRSIGRQPHSRSRLNADKYWPQLTASWKTRYRNIMVAAVQEKFQKKRKK